MGFSPCVASYGRRVARGAPLLHTHTSAVRRSRVQGCGLKILKIPGARVRCEFPLLSARARTTRGCYLPSRLPVHTLCFSHRARYHFYCRREARVPLSSFSRSPPFVHFTFSNFFSSVLLFYFPPLFFSFSSTLPLPLPLPFLMNINHQPLYSAERDRCSFIRLFFFPFFFSPPLPTGWTTNIHGRRPVALTEGKSRRTDGAKFVCMVTR